MTGCDECGEGDDKLAYTCNYCSGSYCSQHRLPENHQYPGLSIATSQGPDFRGIVDTDTGLLGKIFGETEQEDAIAREHHPGKKDYKSDITTEPPNTTSYTPDSSSPDVNPDGSIAHEDSPNEHTSTRENRLHRAGTTILSLGILVVSFPFRVLANLPQYLNAFNRWLAQLLGSLYGIAKTLAPIAVILLGAFFVAGLIGTGIPAIDDTSSHASDRLSSLANSSSDDGMNETLVQEEFAKQLNSERQSRGLNPLITSQILRAMGSEHAENMREHDYIGHVQPDGTTIEDRYRDRGLLPKCRLSAGDGKYYDGAENAAGAHIDELVTHPGTSESFYIDTESELAAFLLDSWMTSDGHRKVLLLDSAKEIGLGIAISDSGRVYAALEFC